MLAAGKASLDEIAFRAAYSDRHHMSRDFRRMAQITPSGLRNLLAG
ncbi:helix-turn-helix domain-containing protein [Roseibium sp. M-1]